MIDPLFKIILAKRIKLTSLFLRQVHQSEVAEQKIHVTINLQHSPWSNQMSVAGQNLWFSTGNGSEALWEIEWGRESSGVPTGCSHVGRSEFYVIFYWTLCIFVVCCFSWFHEFWSERDETRSFGICEISAFKQCFASCSFALTRLRCVCCEMT